MQDNFDLRSYLSNNPLLKENQENNFLESKLKNYLQNQFEISLEGTDEAEEFILDKDDYTDPEQYEKSDIDLFKSTRDAIKKLGKVSLKPYQGNKGTATVDGEGNIVISSPLLKENQENIIEKTTSILKNLSSEDFIKLLNSIKELDIWEMGKEEGIDGINNIDDRMNTVDLSFEEKDYIKYYNGLKKLGYVK